MTEALAATARIRVGVSPRRAFEIFTGDIGSWWKRGTYYWNDPERGLRYEFEPRLGGRLLEVYTDGEPFEVGRITGWQPGELLEYTWRQADWSPDQFTTVAVRFTADGDGTRVDVRHTGWESLGQDADQGRNGYGQGWLELLGFYSNEVAG